MCHDQSDQREERRHVIRDEWVHRHVDVKLANPAKVDYSQSLGLMAAD